MKVGNVNVADDSKLCVATCWENTAELVLVWAKNDSPCPIAQYTQVASWRTLLSHTSTWIGGGVTTCKRFFPWKPAVPCSASENVIYSYKYFRNCLY